jgi:alpha-beta hydrolase superfamily lysophospholipase
LIEQILPEAGLVSPRGDVSEHGANRFFRRRAEGVYDMDDLAARTRKMTGFIRAHAQANPGAPVYGLGYSNGANILAAVVFEAPELFDQVVLMHPLIPWTPEPNPALASLERWPSATLEEWRVLSERAIDGSRIRRGAGLRCSRATRSSSSTGTATHPTNSRRMSPRISPPASWSPRAGSRHGW